MTDERGYPATPGLSVAAARVIAGPDASLHRLSNGQLKDNVVEAARRLMATEPHVYSTRLIALKEALARLDYYGRRAGDAR